MFKKVTKIALAGIIGVGTMVGASSFASAEQVATYDSKVNIFFGENSDTTGPVDPDDPDEDITPEKDPDGEDEIEDGTTGPLSIDYASHINFGEVKTSGNTETYTANPVLINGTDERAPYVQVTDNRGTKAGWELQVSQNAQFATEDDTELTGAELSLANGIINSNSDSDGLVSSDVTFNEFGVSFPVVKAQDRSGAGTFTNKFGEIAEGKATDVSLVVPGDLIIEADVKYSTELNWSLEDAP